MNQNFKNVVFICALLTGILFNYLFYGKIPGISFPVFCWFCMICIFFINRMQSRAKECHLHPTQYLTGTGVFIFSFFFAFRAADELRIANFALTLYLFVMTFSPWLTGRFVGERGFPDYFPHFGKFFMKSVQFGKEEARNRCSRHIDGKYNQLKSIFTGLLISIPVLFLFCLLMINADLIFEQFFRSFWNFCEQYLWEGAGRSILLFFTVILFIGIYFWTGRIKEKSSRPNEEIKTGRLGFIEGTVVLSLSNSLFLIFTIIQIVFLVGGERPIAALDITYSQYARQGFWQMIWIGVITFFLSCVLEEKMERVTQKQICFYKLSLSLTSCMMMVIMISAFYRLWLYEQSYGFTILRFYSHTFILYLIAVFVILCIKITMEQRLTQMLFCIFVASMATFLLWNTSNPHSLIAKMNLRWHKEGIRPLDVPYLKYLSDDAVPAIVSGLREDLDLATRNLLFVQLRSRQVKIQRKLKNTSWTSFNIGTIRAFQELDREL